MAGRPGWRGSAIAVALVAGTAAAVVVAWVIGFRQWADGRTPGDLARPDGHEDPTLMVQWFVKGATVGTAYAFVTFVVICAVAAAAALSIRRRRQRGGRPPV
jgi:hypothetical protein